MPEPARRSETPQGCYDGAGCPQAAAVVSVVHMGLVLLLAAPLGLVPRFPLLLAHGGVIEAQRRRLVRASLT